MLSFCGNSSSLLEPWTDKGFSHCFLETTTSSILAGFIIIFGGIQMGIYKKYSTSLDQRFQPQSCLYKMQIVLSICMSLLSILRLILEATVIGDKQVYIYQIMSAVFYTVMWPVSVMVMVQERKRMLPSIPTRGHGLVLLLFWSLAFIIENIAFISWYSPEWWWHERE